MNSRREYPLLMLSTLQGLLHIQNIWPRKVGEGAPTSTPDSNARTLSETTPVRVEYSPACQKMRSNGHGRPWPFPNAKLPTQRAFGKTRSHHTSIPNRVEHNRPYTSISCVSGPTT